jgi:hypothetical protein
MRKARESMAKFTILKPPPGHVLRIPTVAGAQLNMAFFLNDAEYAVDGVDLRITLPDHTVLILDNLLVSAAQANSAPLIIYPEHQPIDTHELLLSMGVSAKDLAAFIRKQPKPSSSQEVTNDLIDELLASSLDMQSGAEPDQEAADSLTRNAWLKSSYILPIPSQDAEAKFNAQLASPSPQVKAGDIMEVILYFTDQNNSYAAFLPQPVTIYLAFIPGGENYHLFNFIEWEQMKLWGAQLITQTLEVNQMGACLLRLTINAGCIQADQNGFPRMSLLLPMFENYLKGAVCSVVMVAAVGHDVREGAHISINLEIEPNYQAHVIYSTPKIAEAFCFIDKSLEIVPPNLILRDFSCETGDVVNIAPLLEAMGPGAAYTLTQMGQHLRLLVFNENFTFRLVMEHVLAEDLVAQNAFIAIEQPMPEWMAYRYISPQYVAECAVKNAEVLLTVKNLLNAFLEDEDYVSMGAFLEHLGSSD